MSGPPLTIVAKGGIPVRQVDKGGAPFTLVARGGVAATLSPRGVPITTSGGTPTPTPTPTPAPSWSVQPSIDDTTPELGQLLTGSDGTISNGTVSGRQWYRFAVAIPGATNSTYTTTLDDLGAELTFVPTATGAGGSAFASSPATSVVVPKPNPTQKVVFSGHSWTASGTLSNYSVYYIAGRPEDTPSTVGVAGHTLALWASSQRASIVSANPGVAFVHLATNDYIAYPVAANYLTAFWAELATLRAALPNAKLVVVTPAAKGTAALTGGNVGFNAWAATVSTGIRAQKGVLFDEIADFFATPGLDTEAAANDTNYWNADGLHVAYGGTLRLTYPVIEPVSRWMLGKYNKVFLKLNDLKGQTASATNQTTSMFTIAGMASTERQMLRPGAGLRYKKNGGSSATAPVQLVNGDTIQFEWDNAASGITTFSFVLGDTTYSWRVAITGTDMFVADLVLWDLKDETSVQGGRKMTRVRDKAGTHDGWSWGNNNEPDYGNPTYTINGKKTAKFDGTMKLWGDISAAYNNGGVVLPDSFDFYWLGWHDGGTGWDAATTYIFNLLVYADGSKRIGIGNNSAAAPGVYRLTGSGVGTVASVNAAPTPSAGSLHLIRLRCVDNDRIYMTIDGGTPVNTGAGPYTGWAGTAISLVSFATAGGAAETKGLLTYKAATSPQNAGELADLHAQLNAAYSLSLP